MTERPNVLDRADPFCPKCGHNRDTSSVSSIDHGGGMRSCQMCGTAWREVDADGVPVDYPFREARHAAAELVAGVLAVDLPPLPKLDNPLDAGRLIRMDEAQRRMREYAMVALRAAGVNVVAEPLPPEMHREIELAWNDLPDAIKAHPGVKRLYRACGVNASDAPPMSDNFRDTVRARPLAYSLDDYWQSVAGEGPMGFTWKDKPHRIVYDLLGAVRYYSERAAGVTLAGKDKTE